MKRLFLLSFFYLLFSSTNVYAVEPSAGSTDLVVKQNAAIVQRIKNANKKFAELLAQSPSKNVNTIIHFRNSTTLNQIATKISRYNLGITGFRFSDSQGGSGGYTLKQNETVAQAIKQFKLDRALFMKRDYNLTKKILSNLSKTRSAEDPQISVALSNRLSNIQQMQVQFKTRGLQIVGVELKGTVSANDQFRKENNFVNVVEIQSTSGTPQPSIPLLNQ